MTFADLACGLLWLFIFATPFELRLNYGGVSVAGLVGYFSLAFGLLGVLWRNRVIEPSLGYVWLLGFGLWSTISIAWSDYPDRALGKVLMYWGLIGFVGLMIQYASNRRVRLWLLSAYVVGCWCGVISVILSYRSGIHYKGLMGRYSSSFGDPNFLALALVIGVPIACYVAACHLRLWKRLLFMSYVPAAIAAIIVTGSRGAVLSLVGASVAFGIYSIHRIRLKWLLGVLVVCLAIVYALPSDARARLSTIPEELQYGTLANRRPVWDAGAALVAEHPLRGLGAGGGDAALSSVFGAARVAHNVPIALALDGGAVSLVLFYGALLCSWRRVWRYAHAERAFLLAVCVAWLIGTCSLSWESHKVTWFIVGLLLSAVPHGAQARFGTNAIQRPKT